MMDVLMARNPALAVQLARVNQEGMLAQAGLDLENRKLNQAGELAQADRALRRELGLGDIDVRREALAAQSRNAEADRAQRSELAKGENATAVEVARIQSEGRNAVQQAEASANSDKTRAAFALGLINRGYSEDEARRITDDLFNPSGSNDAQAEQPKVYLGGTATEREYSELEAIKDNPYLVRDYLSNKLGLKGAAFNRAINRLYSDDWFSRRTYDNPTGSFFTFDSGVDAEGNTRRNWFGVLKDFLTGDDLEVRRNGQRLGTRRELKQRHAGR